MLAPEQAASGIYLHQHGGEWVLGGAIDAARKKQTAAPGLQEPAKKALATLDREWDGLAAHREYPMISLDDNAAERALRRPVVTRKNAYGSRTGDAARIAARIWTVTATAEMAPQPTAVRQTIAIGPGTDGPCSAAAGCGA
ncbi:MAG: IS66 family transposase [Trebonia sp.]